MKPAVKRGIFEVALLLLPDGQMLPHERHKGMVEFDVKTVKTR
jgi:hypothetical protein